MPNTLTDEIYYRLQSDRNYVVLCELVMCDFEVTIFFQNLNVAEFYFSVKLTSRKAIINISL